MKQWSFVSYLPHAFVENMEHLAGPSWIFHDPHVEVTQVFMSLVALVLGLGLGLASYRRCKKGDVVIPPKTWNAFNFFDIIIEALLASMETLMPRDKAIESLPLMTGFAVFILLSNSLGLIPGCLPATESLNTTFALGFVAFVWYNYRGIKEHGVLAYFREFAGPMWWLAPLMFPIELVSHLVRPCSLAIRLMGNMFGDHMVLTMFLGFNLLFVPVPLMLLGVVVILVQTLVFTLLAVVYVAMAIEEEEHEAHGAHGHEAEAHA